MNIKNLKPLTLEQLKQMVGKPVFTVGVSCTEDNTNSMWDIVESIDEEKIEFGYSTETKEFWNYDLKNSDGSLCGCAWLAYAYPPVHIDRSKWGACKLCSLPDGRSAYRLILAETCGGEARFCPICGRPLTDEAWAELERRLTE